MPDQKEYDFKVSTCFGSITKKIFLSISFDKKDSGETIVSGLALRFVADFASLTIHNTSLLSYDC